MVIIGSKNSGLVDGVEKDEGSDKVAQTIPADERSDVSEPNSESNKVVITTGVPDGTLAEEKRKGSKFHADVVKSELRVKLLRKMTNLGVGTNRIEDNQIKSRRELIKDTGRRVEDIKAEMTRKTRDAEKDASNKRWIMNKWRKDLESGKVYDRNKVQRLMKKMKAEANVLRQEISAKNDKAVEFKCKKWSVDENVRNNKMFKEEPRLREYSELSVFNGGYREEEENEEEKWDIEINSESLVA